MVYITTLPLYFFSMVNRIRRVSPAVPVPDLRVAFLVTKAPSEPWSMVRTTLEAMLTQVFPREFDVWLCDEAPAPETVAWCAERGVQISTRQGIDAYQRTTWPRRRRCKEGNLAWFYDNYGYDRYDVVAQLDADHVPGPGYLIEMVRPFREPGVGYVAAPSVCDANREVSWSVRGRLHEEAGFHGPLQTGHNDGYGPVCIGSHYAVRTQALQTIGGIGPELAEDFSTAYLLNVAGWHGVFAINAHAHGDGPDTFAAVVTQEFQWSRSLTTLLLTLMPRTISRLPDRLATRCFFSLVFTPLVAVTALAGLVLIGVAAAFDIPWVRVNYFVFIGYWWLLAGWVIAVLAILRRRRLLRPQDAPLLSWERWLYVLSRGPFVFYGAVVAVLDVVSPRAIDFKVTPKGQTGPEPFPTGLVLPFAAIVLALTTCALWGLRNPRVIGYVALCLLSATIYLVVMIALCRLHAASVRRRLGLTRAAAFELVGRPLGVALLVSVPVVIGWIAVPMTIARLLTGG